MFEGEDEWQLSPEKRDQGSPYDGRPVSCSEVSGLESAVRSGPATGARV